MNIELYINRQLCDIGNPRDLGIVLKRVFIKPSELNTKDAQKSYDITLPATPRNNEIFAHTNIEEVQSKFTAYPDAQLYINGIKILDGKFRLSGISKDSYRGNLGVPAPLTAKDIFGETNMNQAGKWLVPFGGITDMAYYNSLDYKDERSEEDEYNYGNIPPCIFPFVLYKLLKKNKVNGSYSNKNILDNSVKFELNDFPPSVNCIHMLRRIFKNANYALAGNALDDERLKNLYVSYKNPNDYPLQWGIGEIKIHGTWSTIKDGQPEFLRANTGVTHGESYATIAANVMEFRNAVVNAITDNGGNLIKNGNGGFLKISAPGLYKLVFDVELKLPNTGTSAGVGDTIYIGNGTLNESAFEVKILRNVAGQDISPYMYFDNVFTRNNFNQYPNADSNVYPAQDQVNFIDPYQNKNFICGFNWGNMRNEIEEQVKYLNPLDSKPIKANPMAISGGTSWTKRDHSVENPEEYRAYSAVYSPSYKTLYGEPEEKRFEVNLKNAPEIKVGTEGNRKATGRISQLVWLDKDDTLTIVITSSLIKVNALPFRWHWINQKVTFDLSLEQFNTDQNWLGMNDDGSSKKEIIWAESLLPLGKIDLIHMMPSGVKVNDWIENFCKAFNLNLVNTGGNKFELNIKNRDVVTNTSSIIDLDSKVNVKQCQNEPLRLPYMYDLGFTVDTSEDGYYRSMTDEKNENGQETGNKVVNTGKDGGGKFYTGSYEASKVEQKSSFSYCWYRSITDNRTDNKRIIELPVITDREVWDSQYDYEETMDNTFYDKAQRFWYRNNKLDLEIGTGHQSYVALVSGQYESGNKKMILNYKNEPDSIMRNYFLMLTNEKNYTTVECYLTAEEYDRLPYSLARLNGDLYNIAEIDGYDPLGGKKTKLKLIKRIK